MQRLALRVTTLFLVYIVTELFQWENNNSNEQGLVELMDEDCNGNYLSETIL